MLIKNKEYLRSMLFGVEDSLVSTTGLVAGISVGTHSTKLVLLAGIVAICIEAVSMGAGEYLSDDAVQELDKMKRHKDDPLRSGLLMLVAYFVSGFVPLLPVVLLPFPASIVVSVCGALFCLFALGFLKGKLLGIPPMKGALKFLLVGGVSTILGLLVGLMFQIY